MQRHNIAFSEKCNASALKPYLPTITTSASFTLFANSLGMKERNRRHQDLPKHLTVRYIPLEEKSDLLPQFSFCLSIDSIVE
jgi:hypothetical protein